MEGNPTYHVPEWDPSVELAPNFFCRARNMKREKYCRARAGQGTEHLGQGRCKNHGGSTPIQHGRYSEVVRGTLGEHIDRLELETEKEKLDVLPEATLMRGLTLDLAERWEQYLDAIIHWNECEQDEAMAQERRPKFMAVPTIDSLADLAKKSAEVVNMVHKQRSANAVSLSDFYRLMAAMAESVNAAIDTLERHIDPTKLDVVKAKISEEWRKIKLKA